MIFKIKIGKSARKIVLRLKPMQEKVLNTFLLPEISPSEVANEVEI